MKNLKKNHAKWTAMLALAGAGLCGVANAGPMTWTDTLDRNDYLSTGSSVVFTHDISDGANGFNTGTDDVYGYSLAFDLYDDPNDRTGGSLESAFAWLGSTGSWTSFNLAGAEYGGWTLIGHLQLELTGTLTVAISSLIGDFYLGSSTLAVNGVRNSSVPEPGTLALFGAALLGFGLVRRKRAEQQ